MTEIDCYYLLCGRAIFMQVVINVTQFYFIVLISSAVKRSCKYSLAVP